MQFSESPLYSGCFLVGVPSVHPISPQWTQAETVYSGSAEPDRANTREGNKSNHPADMFFLLYR
ncbi:hypothetical protein XCR1_1330012 [Xenorhabdus cabanillasii JM26]|uniref:Uncharacterized protein n=1 Tax=Xenorhabdus cabanillasii JM26 TaxID=1427517 RepID=W1ING2_9GAMM|nr:hypothetical protein XCR1_1330012 [Xenorhabdus cabanillasii JM26]